jgi:hypothetical protein
MSTKALSVRGSEAACAKNSDTAGGESRNALLPP